MAKAKKDVLLALAFDFQDAPNEVKEAAKVYQDSWLASEKAEIQAALWNDLALRANSTEAEAERAFRKALANWDPSGSKNPTPEATPEKAAK